MIDILERTEKAKKGRKKGLGILPSPILCYNCYTITVVSTLLAASTGL